jgi:predicted acyl esterase
MSCRRLAVALVFLSLSGCGVPAGETPRQASTEYRFGSCGIPLEVPYEAGSVRFLYVPIRDGVRIALDVVLPDNLPRGARVPTILTMTRYWRSWEGDGASELQRFFAGHGYAVVWGHSRGTEASFGVWPHHRSRDETLDFGEVMDWIVAQS